MNSSDRSADVVSINARKVRAEVIDPTTTLIRMNEVMAITGLSRGTIYKKIKDDTTFPRQVKLGKGDGRASPVGFVLSEVQAWVRGMIAVRDKSDEEDD